MAASGCSPAPACGRAARLRLATLPGSPPSLRDGAGWSSLTTLPSIAAPPACRSRAATTISRSNASRVHSVEEIWDAECKAAYRAVFQRSGGQGPRLVQGARLLCRAVQAARLVSVPDNGREEFAFRTALSGSFVPCWPRTRQSPARARHPLVGCPARRICAASCMGRRSCPVGTRATQDGSRSRRLSACGSSLPRACNILPATMPESR